MGELYTIEEVKCREAVAIIGFSGYPDALYAASTSMMLLREKLGANKIGFFYGDYLYNYTIVRPVASIVNGVVREIEFPEIEIFHARHDDRDFILLTGPEPHLSWSKFIDDLIGLLVKLDVNILLTLGSYVGQLNDVHVLAVVSEPDALRKLGSINVDLITYEGPCCVYTPIVRRCSDVGISGVSLWAGIPYNDYVILQSLNKVDWRAVYKLVEGVILSLGLKLDVSDVVAKAYETRGALEEARGKCSKMI